MAVSTVGTSSPVAAAFRQARAADARAGSPLGSARGAGAATGEGGATAGETAAIKALKAQLADAQAALQRLVDGKAGEQAIRSAQQRVAACASALAAALTEQAKAAKESGRAASGGAQYI